MKKQELEAVLKLVEGKQEAYDAVKAAVAKQQAEIDRLK